VGSLRWVFAPTASRIARRLAPRSFLTRLLDAEVTSLLMLVTVYRMNSNSCNSAMVLTGQTNV
jgi:hypothetical protein